MHLLPYTIYMQISPVIAPHVREYVHHMLLYLCRALPPSAGRCFTGELPYEVNQCARSGTLLAAWAVGGEVIIIILLL